MINLGHEYQIPDWENLTITKLIRAMMLYKCLKNQIWCYRFSNVQFIELFLAYCIMCSSNFMDTANIVEWNRLLHTICVNIFDLMALKFAQLIKSSQDVTIGDPIFISLFSVESIQSHVTLISTCNIKDDKN